MGPPPKRRGEKRRPNSSGVLIKVEQVLPPGGRKGDPPTFPLPHPEDAELAVWAELWTTPQAVAWEQLGWVRVVARYVRDLLEAERPRAAVALKAEVRQAEDRLGLTPMAMLRLRWEIGEVEEVKKRGRASVTPLRAVAPTA